MWQSIQVWMIHGTMICFDGIVDVEVCGIYFAWYETRSFGLCPRGLFLGDWVGVVVGEVGEAKKKNRGRKGSSPFAFELFRTRFT